jgi:hypothetical protein
MEGSEVSYRSLDMRRMEVTYMASNKAFIPVRLLLIEVNTYFEFMI